MGLKYIYKYKYLAYEFYKIFLYVYIGTEKNPYRNDFLSFTFYLLKLLVAVNWGAIEMTSLVFVIIFYWFGMVKCRENNRRKFSKTLIISL